MMNILNTLKKIWSASVYCLILGMDDSVQAFAFQAEDPPSVLDSETVICVSANLVAVPVSVTDTKGQIISDLGINDFLVQEDGRIETISKVADAEETPLQIALLFDLSGSLNSRFEFEQQAAIRFLQRVWKKSDSITIITFNEQSQIRIKNCKSLDEAMNVLRKLSPTESPTAFYDAVIMASRVLHQSASPEVRRSVIALSDGEDNRSDSKDADALREFQESDAIFYSINPSGSSTRLNEISKKGQEEMASIAAETGGTAFVSDTIGDLDEIFARIANELRAQYLLSYYSSNSHPENRFRKIAVTLPTRPDLQVRARQGYIAIP